MKQTAANQLIQSKPSSPAPTVSPTPSASPEHSPTVEETPIPQLSEPIVTEEPANQNIGQLAAGVSIIVFGVIVMVIGLVL